MIPMIQTMDIEVIGWGLRTVFRSALGINEERQEPITPVGTWQ